MTKRKMCAAGLVASGLLVALSAGCKDNNPVPPPPKDPIELLYPAGGESLKVDSTVMVRWQINDSAKVSSGSVALEISINNGLNYLPLRYYGFTLDTSYFSWTVASGQVSTQCIVRVRDYSDYSVFDKSGVFTVY
jgi:hypothetical protein